MSSAMRSFHCERFSTRSASQLRLKPTHAWSLKRRRRVGESFSSALPHQRCTSELVFSRAVIQSARRCPLCGFNATSFLVIADAHNFAVSDIEQGFGFAWLNDSVIQNRSYLRYHFVEAMPLGLIAGMRATGIHAACVNFNGRGFLLTGDSGSGKSTLSYACARAGWTYITDDASFLPYDEDDLQVVGNSHQVRFRPSAAELFPELEGLDIAPRAEGKPSVQISTDEIPGLVTAEQLSCRLHRLPEPGRSSGGSRTCSFSQGGSTACLPVTYYALPEIQRREEICIEKLLAAEVYELRYRDLDQAVQLLEALARGDL